MILDPQRHRKSRKRTRLEVSDSDVNIDVDDCWTNNDNLRFLEQFLGNTVITYTSDDSTNISEVVTRFLGNDFLEILAEKSNLYHAQNADKYKTP
jgi:PhoPQ-activated pathogenicity-related protein